MTIHRRDGILTGQRPGTRDAPLDGRTTREIASELRALQGQRDRAARRGNSAYGTLNLDEWTEATSVAKKLVPPPAGRPRKNGKPRQKALDDDEIARIFG